MKTRSRIVMADVMALALKDHGRDRTLKGLRSIHPLLTLQGPSAAMVLQGLVGGIGP